ncbi:hypothetical protein J7E50_10640 [Pedobacter sp. ISL-68]|uniref:hypothetical protein n=1 Tax=unclassified Pedobacter TaxID=2628915 RepID=UPI001BE7BC0E|nr:MULTISPECIES: hypothetical protein [unclassified Pedobacter]MBT2561287.1 hypothetical protein [Pedobacter sp. ISL-64]MBT2590677.1 hypothetical protein [Pedobacter sp. ISL-68]
MEHELSRIEQDLLRWENREQNFSRLFKPSVIESRPFLKDKLDYYDGLLLKYRHTSNPDERIGLNVLRKNRNDLELQLYPRFISRLLNRFMRSIMSERVYKQASAGISNNMNQLRSDVSAAGFAKSFHLVERAIQKGSREFTIPATYYINPTDRMDFDLSFKMDHSGQYTMDSYHASCKTEDNSIEHRYLTVKKDGPLEQVTAKQAYHLLCGRAVCNGQDWVQLDFNDKYPDGSFRAKVFPPDYGFDIERKLSELNIDELQSPQVKHKIIEDLKNGEKVEVHTNRKKIELQANPQTQSLSVFGGANNVIQFPMTATAFKYEVVQEQKNEVRNGMKIH